MRISLSHIVLAVLGLWLSVPAYAQHEVAVYHRKNDSLHVNRILFDVDRVSPNRSVATTLGDMDLTVEWGAPSLRGRPFRALVSTYKVWRTGANEATVISFDKDVIVEGERLPAGQYALFTVGGNKNWTIIFNSEYQQWGAFNYQRPLDVLRVKVPPEQAEAQEVFTISFDNTTDTATDVVLHWGTFRVPFHVEVAPSS